MPFRVGDRVKEYTLSTGVGGVSLIGAYSGFQKFDDVLTSGDTTYYLLEENDSWEVGLGTYGSNNLERTSVFDSSNSGSKISLGGSGTVSVVYPASKATFIDDLNSVSGIAAYASGNVGTGAGDVTTEQLNYVSGIAIYGSGQAIENESQISSVSGWANATFITSDDDSYVSGVASYASGQALENQTEISSVSGWAESYIDSQDHSAASVSGWAGVYADAGDVAVSGWALSYIDSQDHSAASVSGWAEATFLTADDDTYVSGVAAYASGQAVENEADISYVSGIAVYASGSSGGITEIPLSGLQFIKSGSNDEYRIGTTFVDPDGTEQVVRASDFNGGYLRLEVARFSPSVSANGQSRYWDQPVSQWTVTVDNPTDFTANYVSGVKSPLTSVANGVVTTDVTLYSTSGPSVTPDGGVDWTQTFSTDVDSPIFSSGTGLTGGSASATVSFLDKNQDTISETATISFSWLNASSSISFNNLSGNNFLQLYSSVGYNLTISNLSNSSNASTTITTGQGTLSNSSDDGTMTFTTPIHKDNNSGRTITATTDFTRPATVTGTEYTTQRVVSDSSISAPFTYPSFRIFTSSASNPPSRADIVDTNDFDSSVVTELGDQVKTLSQTINNPESLAQCMWFAVRSSASQPTSFQTGNSSSLLSDVPHTDTTVSLEPDSPAAGYVAEGYNLYGITLQSGNTYVSIS